MTTAENKKLGQIRHLILDMDGVLWRGETPIVDLPAVFAALWELEIGFVLATNNATKTAQQYQEKLRRLGVDLPARQILNSAEATAGYLRRHYPAQETVYVIGEEGLRRALQAQGFRVLPAGAEEDAPPDETDAAVVVAGLDRAFNYDKLAEAGRLIRNGAAFIGTNPDPSFPSERGPLPGAGAILAAISAVTGVTPTIIGKPGRALFAEALRRLNGSPANTAMVGDRLSTDIAGAQAAGLPAILLLSGVTSEEELAGSPIKPDWVFADLRALTAAFACHSDTFG